MHLLRDFADTAETYPDAHWPAQAQRALRGLITAWHTARADGLREIDPLICGKLIKEFRDAVKVGLSQIPRVPGPRKATAQRPVRELLEFCRDHEHDVLRFCHDTRIWPTNNISERDLRPTKTQQKISGRLTSDEVTQHRLDIRRLHRPQARHQRHDRAASSHHRKALATNTPRPHLSTIKPHSHHDVHSGFLLPKNVNVYACRNREVPFDLGGSELLRLRNPLSKGYLVDAIVAYGGRRARGSMIRISCHTLGWCPRSGWPRASA